MLCALITAACGRAFAQPSPDALGPVDAVEGYMQDRGLIEPLAALLRQRLGLATGDARRAIADRLGTIYAQMLDASPTADRRRELEELCKDLLAAVPDVDSFELRVNLARATYVPAAEIAEKVQLRLASTEERLEAERILRSVVPTLREVAAGASGKLDNLERKAKLEPTDERLAEAVSEARRVKSVAHYYAGWAAYYLAALTSDQVMATRAAEDLGTLLGAPSRRAASVEKAPKSLFKYEHVARAAIGSALCASLKGNDVEAMRWMDAIQEADEIPTSVAGALFSTKLTILAHARRWADIDLLVRRRKIDPQEMGGGPLSVREARLLAVLSLDAAADKETPPRNAGVIADLAKVAVSDLVSAGELGQVVDLVSRYGSAPIGGNGFAVRYVQGVQTFDEARRTHRAGGGDPELPSTVAAVCNRYREAAQLLEQATQASDAAAFAKEAERAILNQGLALYYAGDLERASEVFRRISVTSTDVTRKQDAAWYAIVSLDKAIERDRPSLTPERDRLAMVFIREYPSTERAIRLLLRRDGRSSVTDEEAASVLLGVMPDSPVYETARLEATGLLYKLWLKTNESERQAAGVRLLAIAEESLSAQVRKLLSEQTKSIETIKAAVSRLSRQISHVALTIPTPEPVRAAMAIDQLEQLAPTYGMDLTAVREELRYRRLQIAVQLGDRRRAGEIMTELRKVGGVYASAGERLVYRQLVDSWRADPQNLDAARQLVESGTLLADVLRKDKSTESMGYSVAGEAAEAAISIWKNANDEMMRNLALTLDKRAWDAGVRTAALCRRLAQTAEATGDLGLASQCWSQLSAGSPEGSTSWFEARYEAIRLMMVVDRTGAATAMSQLVTLYPDLGPEPINAKLRGLAKDLGVTVNPGVATPGGAQR
jgi:tetratricopeptide (TPR) repeat protein